MKWHLDGEKNIARTAHGIDWKQVRTKTKN